MLRRLISVGIFAAANFCPLVPSVAENHSQFARVQVTGLLTIEIPRHWEIKDAAERANTATLSESITGTFQHVAGLAVSSRPSPAGAIIRVSRLKNQGPTQRELHAAALADPARLAADVEVDLQEEFGRMEAALRKMGGQLLEKPRVSIATLDGRTALQVSYKRPDTGGGSPFYVRQFHIPLEGAKALITISHRESDATLYRPILDRVLQSVDFDAR